MATSGLLVMGAGVATASAGRGERVVGLVAGSPHTQQIALDPYPKLEARDLPTRHRDWLETEVRWIITGDERDLFLRLDTDAKRDRFMDAFWLRRDPTPGTPRNEYFTAHYERLAYVDHEFGRYSPGPGWRTAMGRIYVLLGEPEARHRHHNESAVHPVEVWFYQMDPKVGVPVFFYVVFFRERGVGEFELYSPLIDGPSALLNASGLEAVRRAGRRGGQGFGFDALPGGGTAAYDMLQSISPDLADAAFSLIPGEARLGSPLRSDTLMAQIFEIPDRVVPTIEWAYPILTGAADSLVRFDALQVEVRAIGWLDPAGLPFVSFVARAPEAFNLGEHEGRRYLTFTVATYLMDSTGTVVEGAPSRLIESSLDAEQQGRVRRGELLYIDRLPAIAGRLELDVVLENNLTRKFGKASATVEVPGPHPTELALGQPVLCFDAAPLGEGYDRFGTHLPFQVGDVALAPTVDGPFPVGGQLLVFQQVLIPASREEPFSVAYALADESGVIVAGRQLTVEPELANQFGVLNQITSLQLDVDPGAYTLRVQLSEGSRGRSLPVIVRQSAERPIAHAAATPPSTDPRALTRRAALLRTVGRVDEAIAFLDDVLSRAPELEVALGLQIELLRDAGHYERLEELVTPRLIERPQDVALLLLLAEANARQGKHYDAIRYYERARLGGSDDVEVLNALATEYLASVEPDGDNLDRAVDLLRRSLELDVSQAGVRAMLERITKAATERR